MPFDPAKPAPGSQFMRTLIALLALPFYLHAAELERIAPSRVHIAVTTFPDAKPAEQRSIRIELRYVLTGVQHVDIATYWIAAGDAGAPRTVLAVAHKGYKISPGHHVSHSEDSGSQTTRIEGWVITVRDKTSGELLAVKGTSGALETLARTPGALPEKPGPISISGEVK